MGKLGFTPLQKYVFDVFSTSDIASDFYFTGGTALSVFYLNHRESEDLDFFSEQDFDNEPIISLIKKIADQKKYEYRFTQKYKVRIFELLENDTLALKIDFNHYPYKRVEKGIKKQNIEIDSLCDIAGNKLLTINQRTDVKDFVDLYYLLKDHFTIWDLLYIVEAKFGMKLDLVMVAADFLKVEEFDILPRMKKTLTNKELNSFFRNQAKEMGARFTE